MQPTRRRKCPLSPEVLRHGVAVHARYSDVENDNIRMKHRCGVDGRVTIGGLRDGVTFGCQKVSSISRPSVIVVRYED